MLVFKKDVLVVLSRFFWKTIKPNLSKKNINSESKIILSVNSTLVTDQKEVSEIFNIFFHKYCKLDW